eukprot:ctg_2062.g538
MSAAASRIRPSLTSTRSSSEEGVPSDISFLSLIFPSAMSAPRNDSRVPFLPSSTTRLPGTPSPPLHPARPRDRFSDWLADPSQLFPSGIIP